MPKRVLSSRKIGFFLTNEKLLLQQFDLGDFQALLRDTGGL